MSPVVAALLVVSGVLPPALGVAIGVVWVNREASVQVQCDVVSGSKWRCEVPEQSDGIVLIAGDKGVSWATGGAGAAAGSMRVRQWGRLVALSAASRDEDLHDLAITAWKPDRSTVRRLTDRFYRIEDPTIDIVRLSDTVVWVAGDAGDRDRFISFDGPNTGSSTVSDRALAAGPPEAPLLVSLSAPSTLTGRVEDDKLRGVAEAEVELFSPVDGTGTMVFGGAAVSDAEGGFVFERLSPGPALIVATHPDAGRASLALRSVADPALVRLAPPVRATGRVLRHDLPVASARVRFIPEPKAFLAAADPHDLISDEVVTGGDGRFVLALPPKLAGAIQMMGPDGTSVRIPVALAEPSGRGRVPAIALGDINLPDHRSLTVRLLESQSCSMTAVGPLNGLGLTVVQATTGGGVYWFDIPEPGEWALDAECDGASYVVQPRIVSVPGQGPGIVDAQLVR